MLVGVYGEFYSAVAPELYKLGFIPLGRAKINLFNGVFVLGDTPWSYLYLYGLFSWI